MNSKYFIYALIICLVVFQYMKYEKWLFSSPKRELFASNNSTLLAILETTALFTELGILTFIISM